MFLGVWVTCVLLICVLRYLHLFNQKAVERTKSTEQTDSPPIVAVRTDT